MDIVLIILTLLIGIISLIFETKKENKLTKSGISILVLTIISASLSIYSLSNSKKEDMLKLKPNDIKFKISFRVPNKSIIELQKETPETITAGQIKINNTILNGEFKRIITEGRGRSVSSKFTDYIYLPNLNETYNNKIKKINEIDHNKIKVTINLKKMFDKGYTLNGAPRLMIRENEYWGVVNDFDNSITYE